MNKALAKIMQLLPDKTFIQIKYWYHFKKFANLKDPQTYNEKLQWLKLYDRKPIYSTMVDKYEAKRFIADKVGAQYVIPTFGVWKNFDEIDFDSLPEQFVLKTTHDCGGVVICKDKRSFDREKARAFLTEHLSRNYFYEGREWPYKSVKPRILAETLLQNDQQEWLTDYKFFCFDGVPRLMYVSQDKSDSPNTVFFGLNGQRLPIKMKDEPSEETPALPYSFEKMISIAQVLSKDIPALRVDFYEVNQQPFLGELTFFHSSGFQPVTPHEWDLKLGSWIELP